MPLSALRIVPNDLVNAFKEATAVGGSVGLGATTSVYTSEDEVPRDSTHKMGSSVPNTVQMQMFSTAGIDSEGFVNAGAIAPEFASVIIKLWTVPGSSPAPEVLEANGLTTSAS